MANLIKGVATFKNKNKKLPLCKECVYCMTQ